MEWTETNFIDHLCELVGVCRQEEKRPRLLIRRRDSKYCNCLAALCVSSVTNNSAFTGRILTIIITVLEHNLYTILYYFQTHQPMSVASRWINVLKSPVSDNILHTYINVALDTFVIRRDLI
jgi:hypothetical protein